MLSLYSFSAKSASKLQFMPIVTVNSAYSLVEATSATAFLPMLLSDAA
jgi:hypothetical protein